MPANQNNSSSVRALLEALIDYAGLFPPAALDLETAWRNYQAYLRGPYHWVLGRFVVPAARLEELRRIAGSQMESGRLAVLIGNNLEPDLAAAAEAGAKTIELKTPTVNQIRAVAERLPAGATAYYEIPIDGDPASLVAAIGEAGGRAKARTGGLTAGAFPGPRDLAQFMQSCLDEHVAFKATAGLHHPIRGPRALTPDPDGEPAVMHGFLNVFVAAALLRAGEERQRIRQVLEDQSAESFQFEDGCARWKDHVLDIDQIVDARRNLAIGFGSCSFEEPIAELQQLGLL